MERIATDATVGPDDHVLEIGPGHGALTDYLHDAAARYVAIEIDRDLIAPLNARYSGIEVIAADVLNVDFAAMLTGPRTWKLVGNIPYNISSPLIVKLVDFVAAHPQRVRDAHFMLQKEMADRLAAVPGSKAWGRLSVVAQLRFDVERLFDVTPDSFTPPPKVDSTVVRLQPAVRKDVDAALAEHLDRVLRMAFSGRRKRLANALKALGIDWQQVSVDPDLRADAVTLDQYLELTRAVANVG